MLRIAAILLFAALPFAVAEPARSQDRGLGLVVQNNIAAMVVDMNPAYANVKIEGADGQIGDAAVTRYRTGRVKALTPLSGTTNLGTTASAISAPGSTGPR